MTFLWVFILTVLIHILPLGDTCWGVYWGGPDNIPVHLEQDICNYEDGQ